MTTTNYASYQKEFIEFAQKHNAIAECRITTSPLQEGRYYKDYIWDNGACWHEVAELVTEDKIVEMHGLAFKTSIKLWRVEYWSTESPSKFVYCV